MATQQTTKPIVMSIIREGELGLRQDLLIYNKDYHLWRDGEYLGIATYTDDPNIGDAFLEETKTSQGEDAFKVYVADEWKFAN